MTLTLGAIAYVAAAAFVTAMMHSIGGFAGALMLAVAISPVIGIKATVPTVATAMLVSHSSRAWLFRKAIDWPAFFTVFGTALPFIALGIFVYIRLPETYVALFLGFFLLASLVLRRVLAKRGLKFSRFGLGWIAIVYGFLAGTSFGVGLLLGPFLLGAGIAGEALVATAAIIGLCLNVIKTVAFGLSPLLTAELAVMGLLIGLCTIPGHHVGRWVVRATTIRLHTVILESFMVVGSLYFLWRGFTGLG